MNNKTLAILLLVILGILLLILILSCEVSKTRRKKKSYSSCTSCKKRNDPSSSCSTCEASIVSLNSVTADNVYVQEGNQNQDMNITFASQTDAYNTLQGDNNFTYNPSTGTLSVDFINAVLNGSLDVKDGIVYQNDSKLDSVPYKDKNGMILTVENGELKWKNPNDIFSGGGGPVENLSNKTPNGILYQDGLNETKTLSYGSYGDILYINQEGKLEWINPASMESLRGPPGADGIYGLKYKWDAYSDIPDVGEITLLPINTNLNIFNLYVSINDFNRINTEILFSDLKQGDKITVQLLSNDNYAPSQTFEVNSKPIKRGNYFEINVKTTVTILTNINNNKFVYVIISNRGPPGADGISGLLNLENAQKDWVLAYDPDSESKLKWKPDATGGSGGLDGRSYGLKYIIKNTTNNSYLPLLGQISYNSNLKKLFVNTTDADGINNRRWLFTDLQIGDKIIVQMLDNAKIFLSQTFEVKSNPVERVYYENGVQFIGFEIDVDYYTGYYLLENADNANNTVYVAILNKGPQGIQGPPGESGVNALLNLSPKNNGQILAYIDGKLQWTDDKTGGGSGGGSISNLSKSNERGILYQTGDNETSVLEYGSNGAILINNNGTPAWVNPSNMESLRGPQGPAGINGTNGRDGVDGINGTNGRDGVDGKDGRDGGFTYMWNPSGVVPSYGRITLNNNTIDNSFNIFINDVNGINTEILFSGLDKGDKITLNWRTTSSNIYEYRTFTLTSKSIKINNYFQMGVDKITTGSFNLPPQDQLVYVSVSSRPPEGKITNDLIALGGLQGVTDDFILAYNKNENKLFWRKDREGGGGVTGLTVTNYP